MLRLILVAAVVSLMAAEPVPGPINFIRHSQTDASFLKEAQDILRRFDFEYTEWKNLQALAEWNYLADMTAENKEVRAMATWIPELMGQIGREAYEFPWIHLEDEYIKRQFKKLLKFITQSPINETEYTKKYFTKLMSTVNMMDKNYYDVRICDYEEKSKCDLTLYEIQSIMTNSRNPEELKHTWIKWSKALGDRIKFDYPKYVMYANIRAMRKNYSDNAAYWISHYEADDFPEQVENLWQQLKPLYLQLHAYVRRELRKKYGEDVVSKDGPIPAHLLDLHTWSNIADFTVPFSNKQIPDVTKALRKQGYDARSIFRLAEKFFKSINLSAMTDTFWEMSIFEKPRNTKMSCVPQAMDFYDGRDFRIKQCTEIDMEDLLTAHHEMGHVEYFMQYKDHPTLFKEAANPGFHEAISDLITLSVSTPGYLKKIGLLKYDSIDREASLNRLYLGSLEKIAFLPFAYIIDQWRWNVFQGKVTPDNYNCHWWSLASKYQGIEPPVDRSEEDFDPGKIYNIIRHMEYIKYYVCSVIQFQFYKALCIKARQYDPNNPNANPLHQCDISGNKNAGNLLKSMMELGSSKPWPDAMEKITGQRQMDAAALIEYFQPLMDWLTEENKKTNEYIGWKPTNKRCVKTREELTIVENDEIDDEL